MTPIEFSEDGVRIDAAVLAEAFGISADDLKQGMREGTITSRFERGEGDDAGTVQLIFFSPIRRVRITADDSGNVLTCGVVDLAGPPGSGSRMREAAAKDAERTSARHGSATLSGAMPCDAFRHIQSRRATTTRTKGVRAVEYFQIAFP